MSWRMVPSAYSPVDLAGLAAGAAAFVRGDARADVALSLGGATPGRHVHLTGSGTAALILALRLAAPAGIVALPAWGCVDLTAAALRAGVRVRLYDLDPATLGPDLDSLRAALARGVTAVVVAPLYGYPADVPAVVALARDAGATVIEDAAQGAGSTLHGRPSGAVADITVLSFGRGKGVTAGSGGALLVSERFAASLPAPAPRVRRDPRPLAALFAQWAFARPSLYRIPASLPFLHLGEMRYRPADEPREMDAVAAAVLRRALAGAGAERTRRCENARTLTAALAGSHALPVRPIDGATPGFLRLAVIDGRGALSPRPAIGVLRGYPQTLDEHELLRPLLCAGEHAGAGGRTLRDRLFTLPTHSRVSARDLARIAAWAAAARPAPSGVVQESRA